MMPTADERALLDALEAGLSEEELRRVGATALASMDEAARARLLARVGSDTAAALRPLLEGGAPQQRRVIPSAHKIRQEWDEAWRVWDDRVSESTDEHGLYVEHEPSWEPPYLETYQLAKDLDEAAKRLLPLLARVQDEALDPDFDFATALEQTVEEVGSGLPEWIDWRASGEPFEFGPMATRCLLEWEWRNSRRAGADAFTALDCVRAMEKRADGLGLDGKAMEEFVASLAEADHKAVMAGFARHAESPRWKDVLGHPHGVWFRIHQTVARRWDPSAHARAARANIAGDWTLALPLIRDALDSGHPEDAHALARGAALGLVHSPPRDAWNPLAELLIERLGAWRAAKPDPRELELLSAWRSAAEALGEAELAAALKIQRIAHKDWAKWDTILPVLRRPRPEQARVQDPLFSAWRDLVVKETLREGWPGTRSPSDPWVGALAEAARAGKDDAATIRSTVTTWLTAVQDSEELFQRDRRALEVLTLDLESQGAAPRVPAALRAFLSRPQGEGVGPALAASRRKWLTRVGAPALLAQALDVWRHHAEQWLPDPRSPDKSNYDRQAAGMAAFLRLDRSEAEKVLLRWAADHGRRANLWAALERVGIQPPLGVRRPAHARTTTRKSFDARGAY